MSVIVASFVLQKLTIPPASCGDPTGFILAPHLSIGD